MKKLFTLSLLTFLSVHLFAQDRYVIYFTDKNNSPYSVSTPLDFVSQRSVDRRTKQNIPFTVNDLPVNPSYVQGIITAGATVLNVSKWLNSATIQTSDSNVLNSIYTLPYVQSGINVGRIGQNPTGSEKFVDEFKTDATIPYESGNQPSTQKISSMNYGPGFHQINMMNGDYLHDNGFTGDGMLIAIIDAGFLNVDLMPVFDSLRFNNKILATYDIPNHDTILTPHFHGAACFSIMGSNSPGVMVGCAPHADYILLRSEVDPTENLIEEFNWATAAEFADSMGADVLSTSLGYTTFDDSTQNQTYATLDGNTAPMTIAADLAAAKGMVVCNAAGNEGGSSWNYISVPADANNILAVGAVDSSEIYAGFSGNGPSFDGRVKPDVSCMGVETYYVSPWDNMVYSGNGTSFACPLMAGLVACFWESHPNLTNIQIMQAVRESASQFSNPDTDLGYGIPDFMKADILLGLYSPSLTTNLLIIYPNPVKDQIVFANSSTQNENAVCSIIDVTGKSIEEKSMTLTANAFNVFLLEKKIQPGIYFFQVKIKDQLFTQKFIKD